MRRMYDIVPFKYRKIRFTSAQWGSFGSCIYLLTLWITNASCGQVKEILKATNNALVQMWTMKGSTFWYSQNLGQWDRSSTRFAFVHFATKKKVKDITSETNKGHGHCKWPWHQERSLYHQGFWLENHSTIEIWHCWLKIDPHLQV